MKNKRIFKIMCTFIVFVILINVNITVQANKTSVELKNQQENTKEKIEEKHSEIYNVELKLTEALSEISKISEDIKKYEDNISELQENIENLNLQIEIKQKNIEEEQKKYDEQQKLLEKRVVAIYMSGSTTYLDVLLSASSLSDFISKYYLIEKLTELDVELLNKIQNTKLQIEEEKKELEINKQNIETLKNTLVTEKENIEKLSKQKQNIVSTLSNEEKKLKEELDVFEKEKKAIEEELKALDKEAKIKNTNIVNNSIYMNSKNDKKNDTNSISKISNWIFPVSGCSKSNINNFKYPSYQGHTGVDVNINVVGKSVVAVADGTVEISRAIKGNIPNYGNDGTYIGSYSAYGEFVVINHGDGIRTLYGHMKAGSRKVDVGDKVKQGQIIGIVGNTGNVRPVPTTSTPLSGTHLHFEVRVGGGAQKNCVNPLLYLP